MERPWIDLKLKETPIEVLTDKKYEIQRISVYQPDSWRESTASISELLVHLVEGCLRYRYRLRAPLKDIQITAKMLRDLTVFTETCSVGRATREYIETLYGRTICIID